MSAEVRAAVAYVTREDGKILVVWNKRYGRWAMPGGKVEEGESPMSAVVRELLEETGLHAASAELRYEGPHGESVEAARGSTVSVFAVKTLEMAQYAKETEPGCPTTFFTRMEFLAWGLAPGFYARMFEAFDRLEGGT